MLRDPEEVKKKLKRLVLNGYDPRQDPESEEDHWTDWSILPTEEFERIKKEAIQERICLLKH